VDALAGLPLAKLSLAECRQIGELAPLARIATLTELDVTSVAAPDLAEVILHPGLTTLHADEELTRRFARRDELRALPSFAELRSRLASDEFGVVATALI